MSVDMKLPDGKTCVDCEHHQRCSMLGIFARKEITPATSTSCDWSPSRFQALPSGNLEQVKAMNDGKVEASGYRYADAKELIGNCAEFVLDDGQRFAWSESNCWYELVEPDGESFTILRMRLDKANAEIEQLQKDTEVERLRDGVTAFFKWWDDTSIDDDASEMGAFNKLRALISENPTQKGNNHERD